MLSGWCKFGEILRGPFLSFFPSNMNLESEFEFEAKYINVDTTCMLVISVLLSEPAFLSWLSWLTDYFEGCILSYSKKKKILFLIASIKKFEL